MGHPLPLVRLSSLDLVRGFVAVGRRMSVSLAAHDLSVTQSAVSKQIHALEAQLGVKLLVRGHRSISFTAEGERLFRSADSVVQQLQEVMGEIGRTGAQRLVTLSAGIDVAGLWLLPRLGRLQALHPGIDVRLSASEAAADLGGSGIDLAIRCTTAALAPAGAVRLFDETVAPVAHAALGVSALSSPDAFGGVDLLELDDVQRPWLRWREWLAAAGWPGAQPRGIVRFDRYDRLIQAAISGQGVALGRIALIQSLLDDGRLLRLDAPPLASGQACWLIHAEPRPREEVRTVAAWLVAEGGARR